MRLLTVHVIRGKCACILHSIVLGKPLRFTASERLGLLSMVVEPDSEYDFVAETT